MSITVHHPKLTGLSASRSRGWDFIQSLDEEPLSLRVEACCILQAAHHGTVTKPRRPVRATTPESTANVIWSGSFTLASAELVMMAEREFGEPIFFTEIFVWDTARLPMTGDDVTRSHQTQFALLEAFCEVYNISDSAKEYSRSRVEYHDPIKFYSDAVLIFMLQMGQLAKRKKKLQDQGLDPVEDDDLRESPVSPYGEVFRNIPCDWDAIRVSQQHAADSSGDFACFPDPIDLDEDEPVTGKREQESVHTLALIPGIYLYLSETSSVALEEVDCSAVAMPPPSSATATPAQPPDTAAADTPASSASSASAAAAARRRRRIGKACDDCRRRKIKCDGNNPCSGCAEFSSPCTYTALPRRDDLAHHSQLQALQHKLQAAESLLARLLRHPAAPPLSAPASDGTAPGPGPGSGPAAAAPSVSSGRASVAVTPGSDPSSPPSADKPADDARNISLFQDFAQLNLVDDGESDFYGLSSSAAFLSRITQELPELTRYDSRIPFLPHASLPSIAWTPALTGVPWQTTYDHSRLPDRETARTLCQYAFDCGSCLLRTVHVPSFFDMFDKLYQSRPSIYTTTERRFVGLLFSVVALGAMYDIDENDPTNPDHYEEGMEQGYKYYISARMFLQDFHECRNIMTLQAIVFIIQFLQATGNLGGCYTLVGVALRSALRMGLHRNLPPGSLTPIETETRRRIFYTIRQMDIYLSTTLGLPILLQDKDIDQQLPTEVDDEFITNKGIARPPPGSSSVFEAFNAHTRLMKILAQILEHVYPSQSAATEADNPTYSINYARIREIENELHEWQRQLPPSWHPGQEDDDQRERIKILLRFAFAHVQMMLYRPFLHHNPRQSPGQPAVDNRVYALAAAGIHVCRNIVHIGLEIKKRAALIGPYWFNTYTQFTAVLCLVIYILNNPQAPALPAILSDAQLGKDSISSFTQKSLAADRITAALNALFKQLPSRMSLHASPANSADVDQWLHEQPESRRNRTGDFLGQPPPTTSYEAANDWSSIPNTPMVSHERGFPQQTQPPLAAPSLRQDIPQMRNHGLIFPQEDPFAYPVPVPLSSAATTGHFPSPLDEDSMQDIMQFPVYDAYSDMGTHLFEPEVHFPFVPGSMAQDASEMDFGERGPQ
ncbi:fungal-specific transcription factor domain-domain-containing protein [Microdochium bolleyi]|uniref:Fungal-specific transcription factor domain-domain-containing protein n=1 Tax=Microdochium bolleyi TaxID=196109 RepID=A0A136IYU2_9PEZI|nr:fungal-specific transcription factor domain-domain-containing protein [Microdochium bolleyi]